MQIMFERTVSDYLDWEYQTRILFSLREHVASEHVRTCGWHQLLFRDMLACISQTCQVGQRIDTSGLWINRQVLRIRVQSLYSTKIYHSSTIRHLWSIKDISLRNPYQDDYYPWYGNSVARRENHYDHKMALLEAVSCKFWVS